MRMLLLAVWMGSLLVAAPAPAQETVPPPDVDMPEPLPPPDIDEPGVETDPEEAAAALARDPALPPKVQAPSDPPPEVTIRTDEDTGDTIEEYRQAGVVYMVRVKPERGPEYMLLDTNGDGRLDTTDFDGTVRPVYWTIYEWE